jgi:hypothetical protein
MICDCPECEGEGTVRCENCNGTGSFDDKLDGMDLRPFRELGCYEELLDLQGDIRRLKKQAERLIELRPDRAEVYRDQLSEALRSVERSAEKLMVAEEKRKQTS